jgi:hypothetical protein
LAGLPSSWPTFLSSPFWSSRRRAEGIWLTFWRFLLVSFLALRLPAAGLADFSLPPSSGGPDQLRLCQERLDHWVLSAQRPYLLISSVAGHI